MESLDSSQNNTSLEAAPIDTANVAAATTTANNSKGRFMNKAQSTDSIITDGSSNSKNDGSTSDRSKDSQDSKKSTTQLPTFTNEVVVIRPEVFYENEDC